MIAQQVMVQGRIHGLEALRGIAALLVAYNHAAFLAGYPDEAARMLALAHLGVDLFFLLSGFVLTRAYERNMPGALTFTRVRFARLWSPIAGGVLIGAIAAALGGMDAGYLLAGIVSGIMLLPLVGGAIFLNPPAWTIFFELVANAAHALVLKRLSNRLLLLLVLACLPFLAPPMGQQTLNVGQGQFFLEGFPRLFFSYGLGVLLYRWNGDRTHIPQRTAWLAILSFPLLLVAYRHWLPDSPQLFFVLLVNPLVLLGALSLRASRLAGLLGALSFPLYALHYPALAIALGLGVGWQIALIVSVLTAIVGGMAVDPRWRKALIAYVGRQPSPGIATA